MKYLIYLILLITPFYGYAQGPAPIAAPGAITTWFPSVSYSTGNVVIQYGLAYQSLINSNTGNSPVANPSDWTKVIGAGATVGSIFGRVGTVTANSGDYTVSQVTGAAPLASPALTGTPTAPTKSCASNTDIATGAYVANCAASGGTPGGSTTQGQFNNASAFAGTSAETFNTADGSLTQLANIQYLSCSTDLGAQINTAVTALGATGGQIILPNCTTATITTTATNIPFNISIHGYGKNSTKITCSVAGDCLQFSMNPTTQGEIGAEIDNFAIIGDAASTQVLIHANGMSGYSLHDLQFNTYPGSTAEAATCLEFDNSSSGLFTERDTTYNVVFGTYCAPGVLFNQNSGDSDTSFAYNDFNFDGGSTGSNYLVVFNGTTQLYGGSLTIRANHVGPGGGVLQFNNGAFSSPANPSERLYVTAEENGSGSGTMFSATGTGQLNFEGTLINGGGGAPALATLVGGSNAANVFISNEFAVKGGTATPFTTALATDTNFSVLSGSIPRMELCPSLTGTASCYFVVGHDVATNGDQVALGLTYAGAGSSSNLWTLGMYGAPSLFGDINGNLTVGGSDIAFGTGSANATLHLKGSHEWFNRADTSNYYYLFDNTNNTTPLDVLAGASSTFLTQIGTNSAGTWGWSSALQYANAAALDTGLSRTAAGSVAVGNGTQGDHSGQLQVASVKHNVYAVSSLPSASTLGAGAVVVVSDASTFTVGTCTGGGTDTMLAVSNGTSWTCH